MKKQKILIVDDQKLNIILLRHGLEGSSVELHDAVNGNAAIDILNKDPDFDLILMDIQMPGIDGFETVLEIRKNNLLQDIPVIFISAHFISKEFIDKGFNIGAYDYIVKPFNMEILKNKVNVFLALQKQKKENIAKSKELLIANRALKILNESNIAVVFSENKEELFFSFCNILVEYGDYSFVWIGKKQKDDTYILKSHYSQKNINNREVDKLRALDHDKIDCPLFSRDDNNCIIECKNKICSIFKSSGDFQSIYIYSKEIIIENDAVYIINVYSKQPQTFSDSEIEILNSVSSILKTGLLAILEKGKRIKYQKALNREKEELNITLGGITDGVISVMKNGTIIFHNQAASNILDFTDNDLHKMPVFDIFIINSEKGQLLFNPFDILQNKKDDDVNQNILSITTKKGNKKMLSMTITSTSSHKGYFDGLVIVFQDISEQIRLTNQLSLSQKMESVGRLAAGIAHEMNTPLQYVGDNTYFLRDAFDSLIEHFNTTKELINQNNIENSLENLLEEMKKTEEEMDLEYLINEIPIAIERTSNGIERVSKIVLAMKNFAHPSGKQKSFSDINQAIEVTISISRNEWKYVADVETDLDDNIPLVKCLIDEINQVLLNMIINATHAIEEQLGKNPIKKGNIRISTSQEDSYVVIKISDTGIGISEDNLSKIFDPFFTTKEVGKGTGQGLAICHDIIVEKHNGLVLIESARGKGTTFILKLLIDAEEKKGDLMKAQILFVDDEQDVIAGYKRMLFSMRKEWDMYFALSGKEALEIIEKTKIDVIITDMRMPYMDGAELLNIIKSTHPEIIRIVLSGYQDEVKILRSTITAHQFLMKPCTAQKIKETIERIFSFRKKLENQKLIDLINGIGELPSIPDVYLKLEEEMSKQDFSFEKIKNIISGDPGMTAKILQTVNSGFFGMPREITDLLQALTLLGVNIIKSIVLYLQTFSKENIPAKYTSYSQKLGDHSLKVANIAKRIAYLEKKDKKVIDNSFTSGILHDIGKLILLTKPDIFDEIINVVSTKNIDYNQAEEEVVGISHQTIGAYLLGIWGLPNSIIDATAYHHNPMESKTDSFTILTTIHVANGFELCKESEFNESKINIDLNYMEYINLKYKLPYWWKESYSIREVQ